MVKSVKEALEARREGSDVTMLEEQIDEFLETPASVNAGLDLGEVDAFSRDQLSRMYVAAGWDVCWSREDGWVIWLTPGETSK